MNISNASSVASSFFGKALRADSPLGSRTSRKVDNANTKSPPTNFTGRPKLTVDDTSDTRPTSTIDSRHRPINVKGNASSPALLLANAASSGAQEVSLDFAA